MLVDDAAIGRGTSTLGSDCLHAYQCVAVVVCADAVPAHPTMLLQDFSLGQQQRTEAESAEALKGHDDQESKPVGPITKDTEPAICLTLNSKGRKKLKRAMRVESVDVKGMVVAWKGRALGVVLKPMASAAAAEQPAVPPVVGSKANASHADRLLGRLTLHLIHLWLQQR